MMFEFRHRKGAEFVLWLSFKEGVRTEGLTSRHPVAHTFGEGTDAVTNR